jgi:hypothetical protein
VARGESNGRGTKFARRWRAAFSIHANGGEEDEVIGLGGSAGEDELGGVGGDETGEGLTGGAQGVACALSGGVDAGGVAEAVEEGVRDGVSDLGERLGGGVVVEINFSAGHDWDLRSACVCFAPRRSPPGTSLTKCFSARVRTGGWRNRFGIKVLRSL